MTNAPAGKGALVLSFSKAPVEAKTESIQPKDAPIKLELVYTRKEQPKPSQQRKPLVFRTVLMQLNQSLVALVPAHLVRDAGLKKGDTVKLMLLTKLEDLENENQN